MITEQGTESYREILKGLDLCDCLTCEGIEARNRRHSERNDDDPQAGPDLCPRCEGTGEYIEIDGSLKTCSGCLGNRVLKGEEDE